MSERHAASTTDYRWNFIALMTSSVSFTVAFTFINPSSVLPAFARRLTDSQVLVGLAGTIWTAGWTLPQMLSANTFGRDPRNKPYMRLGVAGRLLMWVVPLSLWLGLADRPPLMLGLFFVCMATFAALLGLSAVSQYDFIAREIPANRRGRLQGASQLIGGLTSVGVGALISLILTGFAFPRSYALIFTLGAAALLPGGVAILLLREHVPDDGAERSTYMRAGGWFRPLIHDASFRKLIVCRLLYGLMALASAFYVGHAADVLLLPERIIGQFTVAQTVANIVFGALFGMLNDRHGSQQVIRLGIGLSAIGPAFALVAHLLGTSWLGHLYPLVFVALGVSRCTYIIGFANYVMEMAPEPARPAYIGLGNTISGLSSVWPLVGGWLLSNTSYTALFTATAVLTALAFAFSLSLRPPVACRTQAERDRTWLTEGSQPDPAGPAM